MRGGDGHAQAQLEAVAEVIARQLIAGETLGDVSGWMLLRAVMAVQIARGEANAPPVPVSVPVSRVGYMIEDLAGEVLVALPANGSPVGLRAIWRTCRRAHHYKSDTARSNATRAAARLLVDRGLAYEHRDHEGKGRFGYGRVLDARPAQVAG